MRRSADLLFPPCGNASYGVTCYYLFNVRLLARLLLEQMPKNR